MSKVCVGICKRWGGTGTNRFCIDFCEKNRTTFGQHRPLSVSVSLSLSLSRALSSLSFPPLCVRFDQHADACTRSLAQIQTIAAQKLDCPSITPFPPVSLRPKWEQRVGFGKTRRQIQLFLLPGFLPTAHLQIQRAVPFSVHSMLHCIKLSSKIYCHRPL